MGHNRALTFALEQYRIIYSLRFLQSGVLTVSLHGWTVSVTSLFGESAP